MSYDSTQLAFDVWVSDAYADVGIRWETNSSAYYAYLDGLNDMCWDTHPPKMNGTFPWIIASGGQPTPEPSTLVLLSIATIGLLGWVWRRRQA